MVVKLDWKVICQLMVIELALSTRKLLLKFSSIWYADLDVKKFTIFTVNIFVFSYCVVRDNSVKYEKVVDCTLKQLTALPFAVS